MPLKLASKGGGPPRKTKQLWRSQPPPWTELPQDITANILHGLGAFEILESAQKVCTTWRAVCKDPAMWRVIDMHNLSEPIWQYDLDIMCRHAVDRSHGELVDINIEHFATDDLLDFIAQRSRQLRRLRLVVCFSLSDEGLIEALKRFPLLEELHIIFGGISEEAIEKIGHSCPLLTSFTFNHGGSKSLYLKGDEEALAVARSMPELRHLQLVGNNMSNAGLEAIINGCPHLESLDLRRCHHIDLTGDLGKKCAAQIKCLKRPNDSTADYGFDVGDEDEDEDGYGSFDSFDGAPWGFDPYLDATEEDYFLYFDDYSRPDHESYFYDDPDYEDLSFFY